MFRDFKKKPQFYISQFKYISFEGFLQFFITEIEDILCSFI